MLDWNAVVRELGPRLLRYFRASFSPQLSSELVQETLVRLVRKQREGSFDPRRGTPAQFAFGIAHYVRLEALKAMKPLAAEIEQEAPAANLEDALDDQRRIAELRHALSKLKEIERQIVSLHIDEEMRLVDIAAILSLPIGTVKSHLHRARERLKVELASRRENHD